MQIQSPREIALLVREARRRHRLSQQELATRIGASRQWVQRLEAGRAGVELGLTLRALTALGIVLDAFDDATRAGRVTLLRGRHPVSTDDRSRPAADTSGFDRHEDEPPLAVADIDFLVDSLALDRSTGRPSGRTRRHAADDLSARSEAAEHRSDPRPDKRGPGGARRRKT